MLIKKLLKLDDNDEKFDIYLFDKDNNDAKKGKYKIQQSLWWSQNLKDFPKRQTFHSNHWEPWQMPKSHKTITEKKTREISPIEVLIHDKNASQNTLK